MSKGVQDLIDRRIKKGAKVETIDYFSANTEENKNKDEGNQYIEDNEDDDYVIDKRIKDTKDIVNNESKAIDLENNKWEEREQGFVHQQEEATKKKTHAWGDNIQETKKAEILPENFYFPSLDDKDALKRPKPKATTKNNGLMQVDDELDRDFAKGGSGIKFTNSKGTANLNKFMTKGEPIKTTGPTYDPTLNDEDVDVQADPIKIQGKYKFGYEKTEAEIQKEKYLEEIRNRTANEETKKEEDKPRFINSKGINNAGLFMSNKPTQVTTTEVKKDGVRKFTNSNTAKRNEPLLQGPVGTDSKPTPPTNVTLKSWD